MERKYFEINENSARVAHDMMSMREYKTGSTTLGYRSEVDEVYDLADKAAAKRPSESERVYRLAERYAKKLADYYNKESSIGMMCPSILVSGASNFPTKKKNRQVAAWDRNHQFYTEIQDIPKKIENILYGKEIIKSNDERAIEKLEEQLNDLKERQELMKEANKAVRMKDTEAGDDKLRELGFDEEHIKSLRTPDYCGRLGFPGYELTNINANIHRIEGRIKSIQTVKSKETTESDYRTFKAVENTEAMRYQIIFDGKPDADIRDILKGNGFKWAPSQGAWQRQITANGKYAFKKVIEELQKLEN